MAFLIISLLFTGSLISVVIILYDQLPGKNCLNRLLIIKLSPRVCCSGFNYDIVELLLGAAKLGSLQDEINIFQFSREFISEVKFV